LAALVNPYGLGKALDDGDVFPKSRAFVVVEGSPARWRSFDAAHPDRVGKRASVVFSFEKKGS